MTDILAQAATIVGQRLGDRPRAAERNLAVAQELHDAGLLVGGTPTTSVPPREAVVNLMRCRMDEADAEAIADALDDAKLLTRTKES